jgi:hypothetical protein
VSNNLVCTTWLSSRIYEVNFLHRAQRPLPPVPAKDSYMQISFNAKGEASRSTPPTPGQTKRPGKASSGSISILQRASTALSAAGLVGAGLEDDSRSRLEAEDSTTMKFRYPTIRLGKRQHTTSDTPVERASITPTPAIPASPWVVTSNNSVGGKSAERTETPEESPEDTLASLPRIATSSKTRQRANLLTAFRTWFQDDRKKRKDPPVVHHVTSRGRGSVTIPTFIGSLRGRPHGAVREESYKSPRRHRGQRIDLSSKRSSSANSRGSSVVSTHHPHVGGSIPVINRRSDTSRRSIGIHTPPQRTWRVFVPPVLGQVILHDCRQAPFQLFSWVWPSSSTYGVTTSAVPSQSGVRFIHQGRSSAQAGADTACSQQFGSIVYTFRTQFSTNLVPRGRCNGCLGR